MKYLFSNNSKELPRASTLLREKKLNLQKEEEKARKQKTIDEYNEKLTECASKIINDFNEGKTYMSCKQYVSNSDLRKLDNILYNRGIPTDYFTCHNYDHDNVYLEKNNH